MVVIRFSSGIVLRNPASVQYTWEDLLIYANAVVDVIDKPPAHGEGLGVFRVEVWGKQPNDFVRIYNIRAKSDNMAAREGLDRFVEDISKLISNEE